MACERRRYYEYEAALTNQYVLNSLKMKSGKKYRVLFLCAILACHSYAQQDNTISKDTLETLDLQPTLLIGTWTLKKCTGD